MMFLFRLRRRFQAKTQREKAQRKSQIKGLMGFHRLFFHEMKFFNTRYITSFSLYALCNFSLSLRLCPLSRILRGETGERSEPKQVCVKQYERSEYLVSEANENYVCVRT
jgi:hypothetical protein